MSTKAYAAQSATAPLAPLSINRRDPLATDIAAGKVERLERGGLLVGGVAECFDCHDDAIVGEEDAIRRRRR